MPITASSPSESSTAPAGSSGSLQSLSPGEQARIVSISSIPLSLALLKLGIGEGNVVSVTNIAPLGDPIAIWANGTKVSLRKKDASNIWIAKL